MSRKVAVLLLLASAFAALGVLRLGTVPTARPESAKASSVLATPPPTMPGSTSVPSRDAGPAAVGAVLGLRRAVPAGRPLVPLWIECTEDGKCGDCRTERDCDAGEGCLLDYEARKWVCRASDCKADEDCAERQVCLAHASSTGPTIRRCAEAGLLEEGGECIDPTGPPEGRCALGLVCVLGRCGRQCNAKTKQPCSGKENCIVMEGQGSGCFPGCATDGDCGPGLVCRRNGAVPACVRLVGPDCGELQCQAPSTCEGSVYNGIATYDCVTDCNPLSPPPQCPDGYVCGAYGTRSRCYLRCTSSAANDCPEGRSCAPVMEDHSEYGCVNAARVSRILAPAGAETR